MVRSGASRRLQGETRLHFRLSLLRIICAACQLPGGNAVSLRFGTSVRYSLARAYSQACALRRWLWASRRAVACGWSQALHGRSPIPSFVRTRAAKDGRDGVQSCSSRRSRGPWKGGLRGRHPHPSHLRPQPASPSQMALHLPPGAWTTCSRQCARAQSTSTPRSR